MGRQYFFFSGKLGFSTPYWEGYTAYEIGGASNPEANWLVDHGLNHDVPMADDTNGDGVSLEIEYGLDLDPKERNEANLPVMKTNGSTASMSFYGMSPGMNYEVYISSDLKTWTTSGVTISAPDSEGMRTATTPMSSSALFMRLKITKQTP